MQESHHQPAGAEEACVVLPPICKDKLPSVYGRGCQESPVATELSSISSLSYDSPLASGSAKSGNTPMWQNSRGGQGSAMGGRQNGIFFDNPLSITGGGDESPASVAQPTADAENTHMLCSQGQPPEAEITTASCNVPAEAAAASPAPHESPDVADEAPGTTHTNADDGCDGGTDTSSPGQTDRGKKSHERTTSGSLLPSLISEAEVAALEEWEPSVDCPYSAEVPSTNKVMQRSPKSVSKLDSEEGPIEPSCSPALTSILNEYLENDVPLTHRQRFPSTVRKSALS